MSTIDDKAAALLERPSLDGLAYALRHREVWPQRFTWNYTWCHSCALGLAYRLWRDLKRNAIEDSTLPTVAPHLNIAYEDAARIFVDLAPFKQRINITPEHVADAIDALLASRAP